MKEKAGRPICFLTHDSKCETQKAFLSSANRFLLRDVAFLCAQYLFYPFPLGIPNLLRFKNTERHQFYQLCHCNTSFTSFCHSGSFRVPQAGVLTIDSNVIVNARSPCEINMTLRLQDKEVGGILGLCNIGQNRLCFTSITYNQTPMASLSFTVRSHPREPSDSRSLEYDLVSGTFVVAQL